MQLAGDRTREPSGLRAVAANLLVACRDDSHNRHRHTLPADRQHTEIRKHSLQRMHIRRAGLRRGRWRKAPALSAFDDVAIGKCQARVSEGALNTEVGRKI
jgi:hypothetical protein